MTMRSSALIGAVQICSMSASGSALTFNVNVARAEFGG